MLARIRQLAENSVAEGQGSVAAVTPPREPSSTNTTVLDPPTVAAARAIRTTPPPASRNAEADDSEPWRPEEPQSLKAAGVSESQLEHLALKCLAACGEMSGRALSEQHAIPFRLLAPVLQEMKLGQLVAFRGSAPMNDFIYQLTDLGRERAKKLSELCSYFGAAPVPLNAYCSSVAEQSLTKQHPTQADLERAFTDLLINKNMLKRLGPAVNSGRGLFLFGAPGNGKTSIAERVTAAFGDCIWIPRAVTVDGEIMRVFDPGLHTEAPLNEPTGPLQMRPVDQRWVRVKRPTIVVGGELTMDALEVQASAGVNVSEAPIQMKSNCGTLVIDDFGRQRMTTDQLLNRWIVPLEKRYDFLQMGNGKKIQVPFDQLIIFSTNLEPTDLADEAFLRRIPYKIEISDPSIEEFRKLFQSACLSMGCPYQPQAVDYLVQTHYRPFGRPLRRCHARDLLAAASNYSVFNDVPMQLTPQLLDRVAKSYFTALNG
jgi:hypothetical protein